MPIRYSFLKLLLLSMLLPLSLSVAAKPALRTIMSVKQSDGTSLRVYQTGDERFHYYSTADGRPLVREANGDFSYAVLGNGELVSSRMLAHDKGMRTTEEQRLLATNTYADIDGAIRRMWAERRALSTKSTPVYVEGDISQSIRPLGDINVPVLLVQYKDVKFTFGREIISNNYNGTDFKGLNGVGIGSARDYFIAQSDSLFRPNFVVLDIVTLANDMAYYGRNVNGEDVLPEEMVIEACKALEGKVDFTIFDNDGDGEIEFVYCIYAGYSESSGAPENTVWPHQWTLAAAGKSLKVDGVSVNTYAMSSELAFNEATQGPDGPRLDGIGSMCHEFSHCLGLPDFYDTSGRNYPLFGMDYWDLMDYGCYNLDGCVPISYSAYERDFMGWRKLQVLTQRGDYSIAALEEGGCGYKIVNSANSDEYYILENRSAVGYDVGIYNSGMLVIHVDYSAEAWNMNEVNYNLAHPRYTVVPADNKLLCYYRSSSDEEYYSSLRGDVWPGTTGNNLLTDTSVPAAEVYTGGYMGQSIRNIKYTDGIVSFSFLKDKLQAPSQLMAERVVADGFTARWEAVEYASSYGIELFRVDEVQAGQGDIFNLLDEDFLGCSLSGKDITDVIGDYTIVPGWEGINLWSETGVLRIGSKTLAGELATPLMNTLADGDITLTFKAKKYSADDSGVMLMVQSEFADSDASDYDTFEIGDEWEEYSFTFSKEGNQCSLLFSTEESTGAMRLCIDDISVIQESCERETSLGYHVTTATEYGFSALAKGRYRFCVKALEEGIDSDFSDKKEVLLDDNTAIAPIVDGEDESVEVYSMAGVSVYKGYRSGVAAALDEGVYILRTPAEVKKIYIKGRR